MSEHIKRVSTNDRVFPGFRYWTRLPGLASFCGISIGICAAKTALTLAPFFTPTSAVPYVKLLFASMIIFAIGGILCKRQLLRFALFGICGATLFAEVELGLRDFYRKMEIIDEHRQLFTLTARISGPVSSAYSSYRFRGKVISADDAEVGLALTGKTLQFTSRGQVPPYGTITVQGRYAAPRSAAGPLGFDKREHFAVNNIHGNFIVSRINIASDGDNNIEKTATADTKYSLAGLSYIMRIRVHEIITKASNEDARGIFYAAILNEKEFLTDNLNAIFRKAGIIHLLAISGFHAALLYSAVFAALGLLRIRSRPKTFIALSALWCYLFFIGFIPSLFRATVMATFVCVSISFQRKNHAMHSIGIAGTFWLLMSPHSLFAPGFQLSFAATAGIIALHPVLNALTYALNSKINNKPIEFIATKTLTPLWVSLAGFAATAPPLLYHFGTLSLYGIFFNLAAIPLMSAAMWLFFGALILSPIDAAANIAVWCANKVLSILIYLSGLCEHISWSEIVVPNTTAPQLFAMTIFMIGLCAVNKKLRVIYAIRGGAVTTLFMAATALYSFITANTEIFEFKRNNSTINVIIHKDNSAWIAAQGRKNDIRQLRTREVESLLYRKRIKKVPLFLINEEAEEEAHEFAFNTEFNPKTVILRARNDDKRQIGDGYAILNCRYFAYSTNACKLWIDNDGGVEIKIK